MFARSTFLRFRQKRFQALPKKSCFSKPGANIVKGQHWSGRSLSRTANNPALAANTKQPLDPISFFCFQIILFLNSLSNSLIRKAQFRPRFEPRSWESAALLCPVFGSLLVQRCCFLASTFTLLWPRAKSPKLLWGNGHYCTIRPGPDPIKKISA